MKRQLSEQFKRMQKLAGINENQESHLTPEDLQAIKDWIMYVYEDWADFENDESRDGDEIWQTESHDWYASDEYAGSVLGLAEPWDDETPEAKKYLTVYEKLESLGREGTIEYDGDIVDYIEQNHPEFFKEVGQLIKNENPSYFEAEDEEDY